MKSILWLIICSFLLTACSPNANYYILTPTITHFTPVTPTTFFIPTLTAVLITGCVYNANLNVRAGPGVEYSVIGGLSNGECVTITERNANSSWVRFESQGLKGWIYAGYLSIKDDLARVPVTNHYIIPPSNTKALSNPYETTQPISTSTIGDEDCPNGCTYHKDGCDIKGNISFDTHEKIYHMPGQEFYNETIINPNYGERWFCTENEAIANNWRKSYK